MQKLFVLSLILFQLFTANVTAKRIPSFAGPYRITTRILNNDTTEFHSSGDIWARAFFTHPKPKQLQYVWGTIYHGIPIDDAMKVEIRISKWANNQWKRNAFVMKFQHACSDLLFHASSVLDVIFKTDETKSCPFPAFGKREIKNRTFEAIFPQFPIMPYARYLFTMAFSKVDKVVGVYVIDGDAEPKL